MAAARVTPIDEPRAFGEHELFFSLTDTKGTIRYGNEVFTRISGYKESELIGKPHNVIRHPDMPRCIFRLLWDYLKAGKTIVAYVKNMAADGRHYWVLAAATPCAGGYVSVRLKPGSPLFATARKLYAETLKLEKKLESEHGRPYAIEQTVEHLSAELRKAGYETYDDFMQAALRAEMESKRSRPAADATNNLTDDIGGLDTLHTALGRAESELAKVFDSLGIFQLLNEQLRTKHASMEDLGPTLKLLALNTHLSASRLGEKGAVLSVVSQALGERSKQAERLISGLIAKMTPTCETARQIAFDIAVARLEVRICESFVGELRAAGQADQGGLVTESLGVLVDEFTSRCETLFTALETIREDLLRMSSDGRDLLREVEQMKVAQLNGKIDIASQRDAQGFTTLFDEIARIVGEAHHDCDSIIEVLSATSAGLQTLLPTEQKLKNDLRDVGQATTPMVSPDESSIAV